MHNKSYRIPPSPERVVGPWVGQRTRHWHVRVELESDHTGRFALVQSHASGPTARGRVTNWRIDAPDNPFDVIVEIELFEASPEIHLRTSNLTLRMTFEAWAMYAEAELFPSDIAPEEAWRDSLTLVRAEWMEPINATLRQLTSGRSPDE